MRVLRPYRRCLSGKHWWLLACALLTTIAFGLASSNSAQAGKLWKLFALEKSKPASTTSSSATSQAAPSINLDEAFERFAVNAQGEFVQARLKFTPPLNVATTNRRCEFEAVIRGGDGRLLSIIRAQIPPEGMSRTPLFGDSRRLTALLLTARREVIFAADGFGCLFKVDVNSPAQMLAQTGRSGPPDAETTQAGHSLIGGMGLIGGIGLDHENSVIFTENLWRDNGQRVSTKIRKFTADGSVITIAGIDESESGSEKCKNGLVTEANFCFAHDLAAISDKEILVADSGNGRLRKILLKEDRVITIAGSGKQGWSDGRALKAGIAGPKNIVVGHSGNIYFTSSTGDSLYHKRMVRRLNTETQRVDTILRNVTTIAEGKRCREARLWPANPLSTALNITSIGGTPDGGLLMNADRLGGADRDSRFYFLAPDDSLDRFLTEKVIEATNSKPATTNVALRQLEQLAQRPHAEQVFRNLRAETSGRSYFQLLPRELIDELAKFTPDIEVLRYKMAWQAAQHRLSQQEPQPPAQTPPAVSIMARSLEYADETGEIAARLMHELRANLGVHDATSQATRPTLKSSSARQRAQFPRARLRVSTGCLSPAAFKARPSELNGTPQTTPTEPSSDTHGDQASDSSEEDTQPKRYRSERNKADMEIEKLPDHIPTDADQTLAGTQAMDTEDAPFDGEE